MLFFHKIIPPASFIPILNEQKSRSFREEFGIRTPCSYINGVEENKKIKVMKNSVKVNVKNGLNNIRLWREIDFDCDYPSLSTIFCLYNNNELIENMSAENNYFGFEPMDENVLITELNRLRNLKNNQ